MRGFVETISEVDQTVAAHFIGSKRLGFETYLLTLD